MSDGLLVLKNRRHTPCDGKKKCPAKRLTASGEFYFILKIPGFNKLQERFDMSVM